MKNKKGDSKMSIITQPKFDTNPKEGSYGRLAWYLIDSFVNDRLPEYVYDDLALAAGEIMKPMRQYASSYPINDRIRPLVDCNHISKSIFAFRLIPFRSDDDGLYKKLREMFLNIKMLNENKWLLQKKKYLSVALPYFVQYDHDGKIREDMYNYLESTRKDAIEETLRYYGGVDKYFDVFPEMLKDEKRRSKHWVYVWCFKAICQEGLLDAPVKSQLKKIIEKYKLNRETNIDDFEGKIIDQALGIS